MSVKQTGTPQFTPNAGVIFGFDPSNSNITNALKINSSGSLLTTATTSGVYNSTPPTVTNGSTTPLQTDANGNLKIAGSFSASTSGVYNSTPPTFTNGATAPLQTDVNGNLKVAGSFGGTVSVSNFPSTQAVSASSLPLPTGAATSANQPSLISTGLGSASRVVLVDPTTGNGSLVQAFHNSDNQSISATSYGLMTGGVDQLVNAAGNLDRKRGVWGDAQPVTGLAAELPMIFNGATYDRIRAVSADTVASTGIVQEAVALFNGTTYDRWYGDKTNGAWCNVKVFPALPAGSSIIGKVGIDQTTPGVTNAVAITAINPSTIYSGQQATTTSAAALPSQALVNGVIIKAKTTNTAVVYVGPSGVTTSTGYPLAAGEAISYGVTNLSTIYIIGANTSDGVSFTGN
jgi:hypothetical protein